MRRIPVWQAAVMTAILLGAAVMLAVFGVWQYLLGAQLADTEISLETSRGRERLQTAEYDAAAEELPQVQTQLAELQPQADAAAAQTADLKAERKTLRADRTAKQTELDEAGAETVSLEAERDRLLGQLIRHDAAVIAGALEEAVP